MKKHLSVLLLAAFGLALVSPPIVCWAQPAVRSKAQRDALTPEQVLQSFKDGNERFASGQRKNRDLLKEQQGTATGQYPSAVVLSCIDSRAPAEFVFDKGIGEIFNGRVAGNVVNPDLAGSMEFACGVAGAKLVVVLGHTSCGAINGAIDGVELGNLTGLLERIHPAVEMVGDSVPGEQNSSNPGLVAAVTDKNVVNTVQTIRRISPLLREMEQKGQIKIVGALYDISSGRVRFLEIAEK
jgi:carbonic anhydrase